VTTAPLPLWFSWNGEAMVPLNPRAADRIYVVGQRYNLEHREDRSATSHNHEFWWLHEAWLNLPENLADLYPTPEHLRKCAMIDTGWYDEEIIDCSTNAAALRVASSFRRRDDFALVIVRGPLVSIRTAKSQSRRAMTKGQFQASKSALMDCIAALIGTTREALERERAA
jgi:hypothetical protein